MRKYSPILYVDSGAPPTLLIHGDADQIVPVEQSLALDRRLEDLGVEHELHVLPGVNHAFAGASAKQRSDIQGWIVSFVRAHHRSTDRI